MPRVLMVVFEFPPSNGASVQRIMSFYNAYVNAGWTVDVLTVNESNYEVVSDSSALEMSKDGFIIKAGALDVQKDLAWKGKYIGGLMTPDRWGATWIPSAIYKGVMHTRQYKPDIIFSSAPIPSVNVIASALAKVTGAKWIADYRDPMPYFHGSTNHWLNRVHKSIDKVVAERASAVSFATAHSKELYDDFFADSCMKSKSLVIENGFSEANFNKVSEHKETNLFKDDKISLYYAGVLYPEGRDPKSLFESLAEIKKEGGFDFELIFQGVKSPEQYKVLLAWLDLTDDVRFVPGVPFMQALGNMLNSDCLVLIQDEKFNNQIPGKVYEYLRSGKPILLKTPVNSATYEAAINHAGVYSGYAKEELKSSLTAVMRDIMGDLKEFGSKRDVAAHSREGQALKLTQLSSDLLL